MQPGFVLMGEICDVLCGIVLTVRTYQRLQTDVPPDVYLRIVSGLPIVPSS
jgi:hypothetical protein